MPRWCRAELKIKEIHLACTRETFRLEMTGSWVSTCAGASAALSGAGPGKEGSLSVPACVGPRVALYLYHPCRAVPYRCRLGYVYKLRLHYIYPSLQITASLYIHKSG